MQSSNKNLENVPLSPYLCHVKQLFRSKDSISKKKKIRYKLVAKVQNKALSVRLTMGSQSASFKS